MNIPDKIVKTFPKLNFTVVAEIYEYHVVYKIYDVNGWNEGSIKGVYDIPCWCKIGSPSNFELTTILEEAKIYLHGEVKWDGCSNWYFDEQDNLMLHGCSREDIQRYGDIMGYCLDWTSELLSAWNY